MSYLGNLARLLRDLTGFTTLTFELLQNADDAKATRMWIDFDQSALTVFNDSEFSNCGDQDLSPDECLYLAERVHRCDFHSFRDVASGDKKGRADTTGAFGIGFTAVYQVADSAVLTSNGLRWDIDETRPETYRIREDEAPGSVGTTLSLPWARDPNSEFRQRTSSKAVTDDDQRQLFELLTETLPTAMLFLRYLREVELRRDGQTVHCYRRHDDGDRCEITDGTASHEWLMLRGDFHADAAELRSRFPGKIEDARRSDLTIAVPCRTDMSGLLCAYLPTEERSGVPVNVNADFYPGSDRKRLLVESFQGDWNRLAVRAAARLLASRLPDLRSWLGHERLWSLIFAAHEAKHDKSATGVDHFWKEVGLRLPGMPVMWTTVEQWAEPRRCVFFQTAEGDDVTEVLERLGLDVMHPEVDKVARRMVGNAGARQLSVEILAIALQDNGLTVPTRLADAPHAVGSPQAREALWRELGRLLARPVSPQGHTALRRTAVLPGTDGLLWSAEQLMRADVATVGILGKLGLDVVFLDRAALPEGGEQLALLCPQLDLPFTLTLLANNDGPELLRDALDSGRMGAAEFIAWLHQYEDEILTSPDVQARVRALPVYPSGGGHQPLNELLLPGDFTDPLGLSDVIDNSRIGDHVSFLSQLGAQSLTPGRGAKSFSAGQAWCGGGRVVGWGVGVVRGGCEGRNARWTTVRS